MNPTVKGDREGECFCGHFPCFHEDSMSTLRPTENRPASVGGEMVNIHWNSQHETRDRSHPLNPNTMSLIPQPPSVQPRQTSQPSLPYSSRPFNSLGSSSRTASPASYLPPTLQVQTPVPSLSLSAPQASRIRALSLIASNSPNKRHKRAQKVIVQKPLLQATITYIRHRTPPRMTIPRLPQIFLRRLNSRGLKGLSVSFFEDTAEHVKQQMGNALQHLPIHHAYDWHHWKIGDTTSSLAALLSNEDPPDVTFLK